MTDSNDIDKEIESALQGFAVYRIGLPHGISPDKTAEITEKITDVFIKTLSEIETDLSLNYNFEYRLPDGINLPIFKKPTDKKRMI